MHALALGFPCARFDELRGVLDRTTPPSARLPHFLTALESRVEDTGYLAFRCGEVGVPGGEGEPVGGAAEGGDDVEVPRCWMGEEEVSDETPEKKSLLDVLLAKVCVGGLINRSQSG